MGLEELIKMVEWDEVINVEQWLIVEEKGPKEWVVEWNDEVEVSVEMKEAAWNDALGEERDLGKRLWNIIKMYKWEKRS